MKDTHILIAGDFNYGNLNWELQQSTENFDHCSSLFMEKVKDLFLYQHVTENTRHRIGQSPSQLDLIFINEINMVTDLDYMLPLGASDHSCLVFNFTCYTDFKPSDEPRPNFFKGGYSSIKNDLINVNWDNIKDQDLDIYWDNFLRTVDSCVDKHVPKVRPSQKAKKQPWLNRDAITAVQDKKRAWKTYTFCKTQQNYQKYAGKRNKATRACRDAKINFERKLANNIKTDSKSFWSYVRSQSKTKSGIGDLESQDGSLLSTDIQKAELLNSFFASVFTTEDLTSVPELCDRQFTNTLEDLTIIPPNVKKKLNNLKTSKSPGIDSIHPLFLKECSEELCVSIADLFNLSLQNSMLPPLWRKAQVTPIFKKGNKHLCSNYRPVSLTVILCKVLESFIRDAIMTHMENNNLFNQNQHGFRSKKSCVT